MLRRLLPVFLIVIAAGAFADSFKSIAFTPSTLDSHTALTAVVTGAAGGLCVPSHGVASVSASTITLTIDPPPPLPCAAVPTTWVVPVFIGTLAPGNYDVVTKFSTTEIDRRTIQIADADPPFRIEENVGLSGFGGPTTTIRPPDAIGLQGATVLFDGQPAEVLDRFSNRLVVVPPSHAPGAVTVKYVTPQRTLTAVNAFRYVNAFAPADRAAHEAILIPLVFSGSGAFRSFWTTELWVHNQNDYDVVQFNGPFTVRFCIAGPCLQPIELHQTLKFSLSPGFSPLPHGRIMYVAHRSAEGLQFNLRIRDTNAQAESQGVEIPVVRERNLRAGTFSLLNIPGDAQYRARLRVYSLDPPTGTVTVRLFTMTELPEVQIAQWQLSMDRQVSVDLPAYGEIDLDPAIRAADKPGPYRLQIDPPPLTVVPSYWAFVSVTNNQTQNVTIVTPQ